MQEIILADDNCVRFRRNAIVEFLLRAGPFDMNMLALMPWSDEDRMQLAQLIGYSVSGFGDLPYADRAVVAAVDEIAAKIWEGRLK
jgi:hypothetical protein